MENDNNVESSKSYVNLKFKKPKMLYIVLAISVIVILVGLYLAKGYFFAANVNGSLTSRSAVINELEKQGGKQTLDGLVQKKLINSELKKQKIEVTQAEVDEEIKKIEAQVMAQGSNLKDALAAEGLTEDNFKEQVSTQKKIEKLLADKIAVSDAEIDAYIKDNKVVNPQNMKVEDFRNMLSSQIKSKKFSEEAQIWIAGLTANAKIKYYVNY